MKLVICVLVALLASVACVEGAKAIPVEAAWNTEAPINNATVANASKAASQDRILNENATIDRHINATLVNGSWVDPVIIDGKIYPVLENGTSTAPVIVPLTPNATLVEPQGCDMKMPDGHKLDKLVGEWCSLDVSRGGFYFRGLRSPEGKLLLQRFTLSRHVSKFPAEANMTAAANNATNSTTPAAPAQVAVLIEAEAEADAEVDAEADAEAETEVDAEAETEVDAEAEADEEAGVDAEEEGEADADAEEEGEADAEEASFVEVDAEAEVDLEAEVDEEGEADAEEEGEYELDATFEIPAGSEDAIFMELGSLLSAHASPRVAKANKKKGGYGDFLLTSLPGGVVLPPVRKPAKSLCSIRAQEFLSCSGGTINEFDELVGDEMNGFCLNDQTSAAVATLLTPFAPRLGPHSDFFTRVAAAPDAIAPTHLVETTFNAEQDHARMCFLPGGVADGKRFEAAGNYAAEILGESTGLYKPLFNSRCMSAFCENSGIVGSKKPKAIVLNFRP